MLVLTALGWRLPLRSHMALQALLVGLWVHFGVGPHCRSKVSLSPAAAGWPARCGGATRPLLGACMAASCWLANVGTAPWLLPLAYCCWIQSLVARCNSVNSVNLPCACLPARGLAALSDAPPLPLLFALAAAEQRLCIGSRRGVQRWGDGHCGAGPHRLAAPRRWASLFGFSRGPALSLAVASPGTGV